MNKIEKDRIVEDALASSGKPCGEAESYESLSVIEEYALKKLKHHKSEVRFHEESRKRAEQCKYAEDQKCSDLVRFIESIRERKISIKLGVTLCSQHSFENKQYGVPFQRCSVCGVARLEAWDVKGEDRIAPHFGFGINPFADILK